MTDRQRSEDIKCEYVYDKDDNSDPQTEVIITTDLYANQIIIEEKSDEDKNDPSVEIDSSDSKTPKTSTRKRRNSRYDENLYALPDPETEEDVKIRRFEAQLRGKEKQLVGWKTASVVLSLILLISITANVYLVVEKVNGKGETIMVLKIIADYSHVNYVYISINCYQYF